MRLVITDTGLIWNKDNPFLEMYKDIVLVVCLEGKPVTDKYECFVSPYKPVGMGIDKYGIEDQKFKALASVAGKLNSELRYHDKIVFLTDNEPSTLYPYYVVKDINQYNSLHLITMSALNFETNVRINGHSMLLEDLSKLESILYYDANQKLAVFDKGKGMQEFMEYITDDLGNMLLLCLNGIYKMNDGPCFFDFASMSYVPLNGGFDKINLSNRDKKTVKPEFGIHPSFTTLGLICPPSYPEDSEYVKREIERPVPRLDGRKICNVLKEQRIRLAEANGIPFETIECPSLGPCAGTCDRCDLEADTLRKALKKIPKEQRVYPQFDPTMEVTL